MRAEKKSKKPMNKKVQYPFKKMTYCDDDDKMNSEAVCWYQWEPFKYVNKDALIVIESTPNNKWETIYLQNDNDCVGTRIGKPGDSIPEQMKFAVEYIMKLVNNENKGLKKYEKLLQI